MKTRKIVLCLVLVLVMTTLLVTNVSAATPDNQSFRSATPNARTVRVATPRGNLNGYLIDSLTYVPLYTFADTLGNSSYGWSFDRHAAYISAKGLYLTATPGNYYITANERYLFTVGKILDFGGTVYVPIRPLARAYGLEVGWDGRSFSVTLSGSCRDYIKSGKDFYSSDEVYWLSRIISAEAGGEPFLGQMAVGNVVMNRVASPSYPNTIYGVIFDKKYGTQFTPAAIGTVYRTPTDSAVIAAKICLEGYSLSDQMLFFLNPRIAKNFWIVRSCVPVMSIGNHDFYA